MTEHRPRTAWQERPGGFSWRCDCGLVHKHQNFGEMVCADEITIYADGQDFLERAIPHE